MAIYASQIDYRKASIIRYPLCVGIPYIRVHFINDQCAIVVANILNIGDYSVRSPLSFLGSLWFYHTYMCLLTKFLGSAWYPHGIYRSGPIRFELSRYIKHYVNSIANYRYRYEPTNGAFS